MPTHNCIENVLSMLALNPRYSPATPCSLMIRNSIARAPVPFVIPRRAGAPAWWIDAAAGVTFACTSVWMRVLIL